MTGPNMCSPADRALIIAGRPGSREIGGVPDSQAGRARRGPFAADYGEHAECSAFNALYDRPAVLGLLGDVKLRIEPGFIAFGLVKAAL